MFVYLFNQTLKGLRVTELGCVFAYSMLYFHIYVWMYQYVNMILLDSVETPYNKSVRTLNVE